MLHLFFTALQFYTRLPVPQTTTHAPDDLNRATVFFPFIGWLVGGLAVGGYWLGTVLFPPELAVLFSLIVGIWVTGAFHEDGFADVCDGFGGGWSKPQILAIMKDSRLGTYGAVGLGLLLAVKFFALRSIAETERYGWSVSLIYLSGHSISRFLAMTFIYALPYARDDADNSPGVSKAKPVAQGLTRGQLTLGGVFGILPLGVLIGLSGFWIYSVFLIPLWLVRGYLKRLFVRWIGGYTGDCLGATQQLTEVVWYLLFVSLKWVSI